MSCSVFKVAMLWTHVLIVAPVDSRFSSEHSDCKVAEPSIRLPIRPAPHLPPIPSSGRRYTPYANARAKDITRARAFPLRARSQLSVRA
eukprot:1097702-Pleurochrysis_carterae.AAC.15